MTRIDLVHLILSLLIDGASPMSTFLPEVRMTAGEEIPAREVASMVEAMTREGLLLTRILDERGNWRPLSVEGMEEVVVEYASGLRDQDMIKQLFDRQDIWCEITDRGRAEYAHLRA